MNTENGLLFFLLFDVFDARKCTENKSHLIHFCIFNFHLAWIWIARRFGNGEDARVPATALLNLHVRVGTMAHLGRPWGCKCRSLTVRIERIIVNFIRNVFQLRIQSCAMEWGWHRQGIRKSSDTLFYFPSPSLFFFGLNFRVSRTPVRRRWLQLQG